MKKKGIDKVLARRDYKFIEVINKLAKSPFKELVRVRDYTK